MCYCDFDGPSVYREEVRKSRKDRRCEECKRTILPGHTYTNIFGVWDGSPSTYVWCSQCHAIQKRLTEDHHKQGEGFCWMFGSLWGTIATCDIEDPVLIQMAREIADDEDGALPDTWY